MKNLFYTIICCLFTLYSCSTDDTTDNLNDTEVNTPNDNSSDNTDNTNEEENNNDDDSNTSNPNISTPNILLIIADDMGMDACPYNNKIGTIKPNMPYLKELGDNGIRFNNVWSAPTCSPTRSTILTGKQLTQTGVLSPGDHISTSETSLQSYINSKNDYATTIIGKWHLSNDYSDPLTMGIDKFQGVAGGGVNDYYNWPLIVNGTSTTDQVNKYSTTVFTDLAIEWKNQQTKPWFLWLAYNAAHTPIHEPLDSSLYTSTGSSNTNNYMKMLEAMDHEMGRLLDSFTQEEKDNTVIIFVGDNGTPGKASQGDFKGRTKGNVYNGGINVPMVVSGAGVTRTGYDDSLIQTTDLFATIADLTGIDNPNKHESISFKNVLSSNSLSERKYNFMYTVDEDINKESYSVRNERYKLLKDVANNVDYLYDMETDYTEQINILDNNPSQEILTIKQELEAEANRVLKLN